MYSSHDTLEYRTVIENEQGISSMLISMFTMYSYYGTTKY